MTITYSKRMDNFGISIIRELFKLAVDPEIISLAGGAPAPEVYPFEDFSNASMKAFEEYGNMIMAYDLTAGHPPLREIIARERMKAVGVEASTDNILITTGSQQGIDISGKLFLDEGDVVILESPTYLAAVNTFSSYMADYAEIPMDENGMIMEELEKVLKNTPRAKLIYVNPDFQNPTGRTLSLDRRKRLVELAEQYNIPVIEDNPYIEIRYDGEKLPAIKSFDTKGMVIYLGSFSKICAPGVRIGWVCATEEIVSQFDKIKQATDLHSSSVSQRELTKYMQLYNIDEQIKKIIPVYKSRRDAMMTVMEQEFPETVSFTRPQGGFFTWVTVPQEIDTVDLFKKALEEKVAFVPGATCFAAEGHNNHMRVSYSQMTEDKITEGTKRLARLLKSIN